MEINRKDVILDTDTANELDDQFALSYLLLNQDRADTLAITIAPFLNSRSTSPGDGMQKSFAEANRLLELLGREDLKSRVYPGSEAFLSDEQTPIISPASQKIAEEAVRHSPEHPLFVVAIGAGTNVASAFLLQPEAMKQNTVIVWLAGHGIHWVDSHEFNLFQDVAAGRIIFGAGARLVQLPCMGVVDHFTVGKEELEHYLVGKNPLCDYLAGNVIAEMEHSYGGKPWSRVIWDVTAVAWLFNDRDRFMNACSIPAPIPQYNHHYSFSPNRPGITYVYHIRRDELLDDLYQKLASCGASGKA